MLYIFLTLTWQSSDVFLRTYSKNLLIRTLSSTSRSIELNLRAIDEEREEEAEAIDLMFRLVIAGCTRSILDSACCDRDCIYED